MERRSTTPRRSFSRGVLVGAVLASLFAGLDAAAASITKGPWVQRVTSSSALLRVEVDPPGPVAFEVGVPETGPDAGARRLIESNGARSLHAVAIDGLRSGTRYAYSVRAGGIVKEAGFVTAPLEQGDVPFRFVIYGDTRTDDAAHAAIVRAIVPLGADFLVHTGDFVSNGASAPQWQKFFELEAPVLSTRCIFSCVGNHELTDGAGIEYARFFGPTDVATAGGQATRPEHLAGTFRWGNTRFFFVNGMVSYKNSVDRSWLDNALTSADDEAGLRWRIVVTHHGPWSSGPHGNNALLHDAGVVALLKAHKVDLVLSGHDHIYERGVGDGLPYLVSGGGGAPVYKVKSQQPEARRTESVHHFVDVSVTASSLQLVATRSDSSTIERCGLGKGAGWDCDRSEPARAPSSAPSRCSCDAVGAATHAGGLAMCIGIGAALAVARRRRPRA